MSFVYFSIVTNTSFIGWLLLDGKKQNKALKIETALAVRGDNLCIGKFRVTYIRDVHMAGSVGRMTPAEFQG